MVKEDIQVKEDFHINTLLTVGKSGVIKMIVSYLFLLIYYYLKKKWLSVGKDIICLTYWSLQIEVSSFFTTGDDSNRVEQHVGVDARAAKAHGHGAVVAHDEVAGAVERRPAARAPGEGRRVQAEEGKRAQRPAVDARRADQDAGEQQVARRQRCVRR